MERHPWFGGRRVVRWEGIFGGVGFLFCGGGLFVFFGGGGGLVGLILGPLPFPKEQVGGSLGLRQVYSSFPQGGRFFTIPTRR